MAIIKTVLSLAQMLGFKPFARAFKDAKPVAYECPVGLKHTEVIRELLNAGAKPNDILAGYVIARLPDFSARKANAKRDTEELIRLLIKHGRTHLSLAMGAINPANVEAMVDKANASVVAAEKALLAARERQAAANRAKQQATKVAAKAKAS